MLIGITGHEGILANSLIKILKKKNKDHIKILLYRDDVTNYKVFFKWLKKIDVLIHLAAVTAIDDVNKNKKHAKKVNFETVNKISEYFRINKDKKLIFISSSHVYYGSKNKISENHKLRPITYYGKLKMLAENSIIKNVRNFLIIRLFSYYSKDQNKQFLIPSLISKIRNLKSNKFKLRNYENIRDISSIDFVAKNISILILKNSKGIINCGSGKGYKLGDLAIYIAKTKFKKKITIDNTYKYKKVTKFICDTSKNKKITGIDDPNNLLKYL
tara:strand:- start:115 stop:930 length:816 start_codon:yes stop_codon:yes gene_type:complete